MLKWLAAIVMGGVVAAALYVLLGRSLAHRPADGLTNVSTGIGQLSILSEPEAIRLGLELARRDYGLRDVVWGAAARLMTLGEAVWLMGGYAPPEAAKVGRDPAMPVWLVVIRGPANPRVPGLQPNVRYESMTLTLDAVTGEVKGFSAGPATSPLPIPVSITPGIAPDVPVLTPRPTLSHPLPVPTLAPTATGDVMPLATPCPSSPQQPADRPPATHTLFPGARITLVPVASTPTAQPPYPQPTRHPLMSHHGNTLAAPDASSLVIRNVGPQELTLILETEYGDKVELGTIAPGQQRLLQGVLGVQGQEFDIHAKDARGFEIFTLLIDRDEVLARKGNLIIPGPGGRRREAQRAPVFPAPTVAP